MKYATVYKDEIENIIYEIESHIDKYEYSKDIYDTLTICRCFLSSIFLIIQGAYLTIENRNVLSFNILARSITEYLIDMLYIAACDDRELNKRFINYFKLFLYWNMHEFTEVAIPKEKVTQNYQDYIYKEFINDVKTKSILTDSNEIDGQIKKKFKKSWTGLDSVSRIEKVRKSYCDNDIEKHLTFMFKFLSSSTHPTVYSCIPYFSPQDYSYELKYNADYDDMKAEEGSIYKWIDVAIIAFCKALPKDKAKSLDNLFEELTANSPKLMETKGNTHL